MKAGYLVIAVLVISMNACNSGNKKVVDSEIAQVEKIDTVKLIGSYVGNFGDNKITLIITKFSNDSIEGRSVVGGNDRPFKGTVSINSNAYNIIANEPGDNVYDGVFNFLMEIKSPDVVKGSWKPLNPSDKVFAKDYILQRKAFAYRQDVGEYPEGSQRLLKEKDVENLIKEELEAMRNEIFARHGYCFKKKSLRELFEDKDWYIPNTADVRKDLTETERKNIGLIKKYEKYAEEYGDDFGR